MLELLRGYFHERALLALRDWVGLHAMFVLSIITQLAGERFRYRAESAASVDSYGKYTLAETSRTFQRSPATFVSSLPNMDESWVNETQGQVPENGAGGLDAVQPGLGELSPAGSHRAEPRRREER